MLFPFNYTLLIPSQCQYIIKLAYFPGVIHILDIFNLQIKLHRYLCMLKNVNLLLTPESTITQDVLMVFFSCTYLCTLHSFKNIAHCISKGISQYSTQLLVQGTQTHHSSTETTFKSETKSRPRRGGGGINILIYVNVAIKNFYHSGGSTLSFGRVSSDIKISRIR